MKICVIGPVVRKEQTGGVATFVESLADAFNVMGYEVVILTNYTDKEQTYCGTRIVSKQTKNRIRFILWTAKYLKQEPCELIIGSTWYDMALGLDSRIPGKKIHYLHGFAVPSNKFLKAMAVMINDKMRARKCILVANSTFTKAINEFFYMTKVDAVFPIGLAPQFGGIESVKPTDMRKYDVIYIGRICKNKGVDTIVSAVAVANRRYVQNLKMVIVGDGNAKDYVQALAKKLGVNALFTGKVDIEETIKYYMDSKVFISLDPKEPYGQTFIEALTCGCHIICPSSGGQIEYLQEYPDRYSMVAYDDVDVIAETLMNAIVNDRDKNVPADEIFEKYSYKMTAQKILALYKESHI